MTRSSTLLVLIGVSACLLALTWQVSADPDVTVETDATTDEPVIVTNKVPDVQTPKSAAFVERFQNEDWESRWAIGDESKARGKWSVQPGLLKYLLPGELGLVVQSPAQRHAIVHTFDEVLTSDSGFVVQYEVRFHKTLECGGAYIKLVAAPADQDDEFEASKFNSDTPYSIMFGPDKCGSTDKVHFIFRHKNPVSGEVEEKHAMNMPMIKNDRFSHVYTLGVFTNNTFVVYIDGVLKKEGSLLTDMEPPVNPPKMIDDVTDVKPKDWVDDAMIPDPEAVMPEDWDEEAPLRIVDETATKPDDWPDAPERIPDPEAEMPEDWDEEADGEWQAPLIDNPECGARCGEWKAPMIANPAYRGKWEAPLIDNPEYQGEWKPKQVENPNYFEDESPYKFLPINAIGFEIWTMQNEIQFDNIFVGNNVNDALEFGQKTWKPKWDEEQLQFSTMEGEEDADVASSPLKAQWLEYIRPLLENPAPVAACVVVGLITIFIFIWRRSASDIEELTKNKKENDETVEAFLNDGDDEEEDDNDEEEEEEDSVEEGEDAESD